VLKVDVTTGSRLHFGLICGTKSTGWEFGGIGMMLRKPGWRLSLVSDSAKNDQITASPHTATRISEFLAAIRHTTPLQTVHLTVANH
jgi:predicted sugar kinase